MTEAGKSKRRPRASVILGAALTAALAIQCQHLATQQALDHSDYVGSVSQPGDGNALHASVQKPELDPIEAEARRDPLGFLRKVRDRYRAEVRDYRCRFTKQERVGRAVRPIEKMNVMFMEDPYSVLMTWPESPRPAQRVLYVKDKWADSDGQPMAMVEPEPVLKLLTGVIKRPIDDRLARSKARRRVNQFGFGRSLDLIIEYAEKAKAKGQLRLEYRGRSSIAGRPTYVLVRHLPYTGDGGMYPDRVLVCHIDEEYLLPTAVFTYADDLEQETLGVYITTDIELNVGLSPADFTLEG
ncbi:MAG: DUF1571 domain-containing protein [Phycisphaerales bacterium]|nr:MAG: DUF1571 domain-containing protein [Phycisphaerales bacterium]